MPQQQKNIQSRSHPLPLLIPITETIFTKKPKPEEMPKENTLSFHLEMIKKIDKILEKHDHTISLQESDTQPPINPIPPPTPIEPRPSLFKTQNHAEITWQPNAEQSQMQHFVQPEEFKTELSETPEFKFITGQEFNEIFLNLHPRTDDRIEVIDLSSFSDDIVLSSKLPGFIFAKPPNKDQQASVPQHESSKEQHHHNKIEIIDARSLTQKTYEDVFLAAEKQNEDIEKKSQLYYLNSKENKDEKHQKTHFKQSYIPEDFDERAKEIQEQQDQVEKLRKQLEYEHEKLKKLEEESEEEDTEEEEQVQRTEGPTKQQRKEQKKLEKLQIRKKRIEERRQRALEKKRQREQKRALKKKQKDQYIKQKENHKKKKLDKDKHPHPSFEFDDELKKVLRMTDSLLEELPEEVIDQFVQSEDFQLYEKVLNRYKVYERVMSKHRIK